MDDNGTTIEDARTKARRERRRLLIGGGVAGSLMLTLPSRRLLASTKKLHGSVWCSFCNAKKINGVVSNTPITTNQCGDKPATWYSYVNSNDPNDGPIGWGSTSFESVFTRPAGGYTLCVNGSAVTTATFKQCIQGVVTYSKGSNKSAIPASYPQQVVCAWLNAKYYTCNTSNYFYRGNCNENTVKSHVNSQTTASWKTSCSSTYSAYNLD